MQRVLLRTLIPFLLSAGLVGPAFAATSGVRLEDFEAGHPSVNWTFSNGAEFPGAEGSFAVDPEAAHEGRYGGRLHFDFSGGGNYVGANLRMPREGVVISSNWNALRLWLKRPEGNEVIFRYTDPTGQTFQKPVECPAERWVQVTIPFSEWTVHWGGANDGTVRGVPRVLSVNIDRGLQTVGALLFDDLRLVDAPQIVARVAYPAYRFAPGEGWWTRAQGDGGATRLEGRKWTADFSRGARWISLGVPDHVLLGSMDKIRFRVRGSAPGHPVRLVLRTHFMTFQKTIGEFVGDGEQELVTDGPPGPGWEWHGGENDGQIHGPLRLAEIGLGAGADQAPCTLELLELVVEASCPDAKRTLLLVEGRGEEKDAGFVVRARALSEVPLSGVMDWTLHDWDGNQLGDGTKEITVPALTDPVEFDLPIPAELTATRKFVEAEFNLTIEGQQVAPVRAAWVAPGDESRDAVLEPESPFGMGVYLNRYGGDAAGLALMERAAQMARDAGVKWSREDFSWGRIEPRRGRFEWDYYDNLLACAHRNGITVYAIVGYWTAWTQPYTIEGIEDYVTFLRAMVRRYQGRIRDWEIWNEPNIFFWDGPKDLYAELLKRSYAVIKEIDPDARVLGLSTAGIDGKYIDRMLELKAPFDVLTIHPYRTHLNDQAFIDDLKKVSDQVRLPDGTRRPVWLTEMGWATYTPHNTLRQSFAPTSLRDQAELIARSYLCAIVSGVEPRTFWYNFRNDGTDPVYFEHQMGIVDHDFQPKPAYRAYAMLTSVLRGRRVFEPLPVPDGVFAFKFSGDAGNPGETIAVWCPQADTRVALPVGAEHVTRINAMGEKEELQVQAGKVELELKRGAPLYLLCR
ncbi:MAG: beta-galactosidase [Verrucomicrobiales bacterium]|nr:beta-galactosidase [Verrucomicrobiales bacterium]